VEKFGQLAGQKPSQARENAARKEGCGQEIHDLWVKQCYTLEQLV